MKKLPNLQIKKAIVTGLTLSIVFSIVTIAVAQELQRTFTVINPSIAVTLNPGGHSEGTTAVVNESNIPLDFTVDTRDYVVVDKQGTPNLLPPGTLNTKYSAAAWIAVTPSTFTLKPGQRQNLNYFIQVPGNATPCGHYAAAVYTPVAKPGQGTGTSVSTEVGALFYITVSGKCIESATVTRFNAPNFQEYGPVNVLTEIRNNGNLHIRPKGTISLSGLFANNTYALIQSNIFPQAARDFENTLGQTFMIGRYKAVLLASYGANNNLPLTATLYFWVFPWRLALLLILIIIAVILGTMYYKKRKKTGHKATEEPKEGVKPDVKEEVSDTPKTESVK